VASEAGYRNAGGASVSLYLSVGRKPVPLVFSTFPAGETCIRLQEPVQYHSDKVDAEIYYEFDGNGSLFDLALLVDAIRREYSNGATIHLTMPYLPYARQDRVCNRGESLSVAVVARFLNDLKFASVTCYDIHSEVGVALLDNLHHIKQANAAYLLPVHCDPAMTVLVSPDAGAEKKVFDVAKQLGYNSVIRASKVRNVATGKIEKTTLMDPVHAGYYDFLIVDDICDGGRTFIELAKVLKAEDTTGLRKIGLYVTHGIFSAGMEVFSGFIDKIYVKNLMNVKVKDHPLIQIV
jgi:ribose-phosphate pyrophosphokinase